MIERTLAIVKPDGVQRGLIGELIKRFEQRGLKIIGMKMQWITKEFAKKHYKAHVSKGFYPTLEAYVTQGPVVAFVIEGVNAVENVRKICGATEPGKALPGTIRGDFAHATTAYADSKKKAVINLIHASGTKEEADEEVKLWFKKEELHNYKLAHEEQVF